MAQKRQLTRSLVLQFEVNLQFSPTILQENLAEIQINKYWYKIDAYKVA